MKRDDVVGVMSREWPLFQSTFPLAVPLALGALGDHRARDAALNLALVWSASRRWSAGAVLFSRREGHGLAGIVGAASVNAAVGLLIIGLKVAVR